MSQGARVVVVGAGIVGASVAYHLALRGTTDVVVLEREHAEITGSSARSVAGVRHQFATAVNVLLSLYSIERLKNFTEEIGADSGLRQVGYLLLVDDEETWKAYQRNVDLQRSLGARVEVLEPTDVHRFVPGTRIDDLLGATFGPNDGYCDPHGIASGYLARARAMGARLLRSTPATGFRKSPNGDRIVAVETPTDVFECDVVVNTAGPWAGRVGALAGLDVPVRPFRRTVYLTDPFAGVPDAIPLTIDVGSGFYMRKEHQQVLFGLSNEAEPSSEDQSVDWDWLPTVLDAGVSRFPMLADAGLAARNCWAGLYEITPDHMPVLGRHPDLPNYVDASGFSGHGVMHSPATGLVIAEEILDGRAHSIDIDPLRITRFAGAVVAEANVF